MTTSPLTFTGRLLSQRSSACKSSLEVITESLLLEYGRSRDD